MVQHVTSVKNEISEEPLIYAEGNKAPTTLAFIQIKIHLVGRDAKTPNHDGGINMPVVRVSWFEGKNHDQKSRVAAEITDSIVRNTGTDPKYIYVIFEDVKLNDWAGGGKLFGEPLTEQPETI